MVGYQSTATVQRHLLPRRLRTTLRSHPAARWRAIHQVTVGTDLRRWLRRLQWLRDRRWSVRRQRQRRARASPRPRGVLPLNARESRSLAGDSSVHRTSSNSVSTVHKAPPPHSSTVANLGGFGQRTALGTLSEPTRFWLPTHWGRSAGHRSRYGRRRCCQASESYTFASAFVDKRRSEAGREGTEGLLTPSVLRE